VSGVVAVDAGGADDLGAVATAVAALAADGHRLVVFGPAARLVAARAPGVELVDAPVSIAKDPDPVRAVRAHPESSIVQAARAVAEGRADALVAGGTTGAALAAGLFHVKRARGIYRPALAVGVPVPGRPPVTLVDVGANDAVRPEHLVQFAFMGAALARTVLGVAHPRVALLANGTEPGKGREEVVEAHARLAGAASELFAFAGNVEGFDVLTGDVDVVVTDGFTGNVALKVIEGTSKAVVELVRRAATSSPRATAGGLLLRPALRGLRAEIDPESVGGAYLLGLRRLVVVPHGSFGAEGWRSAVRAAQDGVREDVVGRTHAALDAAGALRRAGASEPTASV
jgi:glycerol-3-phosphate acyltransferase PlsX